MDGTWRIDVLVRTARVNTYRTLPFTMTIGPGATALPPPLVAVPLRLRITPGELGAPNTVTIGTLHAPAVRVLTDSLDMPMGAQPYTARTLGGGWWCVDGMMLPNGRPLVAHGPSRGARGLDDHPSVRLSGALYREDAPSLPPRVQREHRA
jgi:hypothetical protein